jgi:hypothetical protein
MSYRLYSSLNFFSLENLFLHKSQVIYRYSISNTLKNSSISITIHAKNLNISLIMNNTV